ncbi:hypothetical protein VTI74DRAFT_3997 [Chaetomium olivicolor]
MIKGYGVNSTKRVPSGFEYELVDELATAVPTAGTGGAKQIDRVNTRKQRVVDVDLGQQPKQQKPSTAPEA